MFWSSKVEGSKEEVLMALDPTIGGTQIYV